MFIHSIFYDNIMTGICKNKGESKMTPSEIINWNYSIICFLKSLKKKELCNYKRFNDIDWSNVDTNISKNGGSYICLMDFGIKGQTFRELMNDNKNAASFKKTFENHDKYKTLREFCKTSGMDLRYMYGGEIMIPELAKEIHQDKIADNTYLSLIQNKRSEVAGKVVAYLNDCSENDTVNIWFKYFKNIDSLKYVPELNRLIEELNKLTYDNLIQYRAKNRNALNNIYHKLNNAAIDVAMVLHGRETLAGIVNQFDIEENFKKSGIEIK